MSKLDIEMMTDVLIHSGIHSTFKAPSKQVNSSPPLQQEKADAELAPGKEFDISLNHPLQQLRTCKLGG